MKIEMLTLDIMQDAEEEVKNWSVQQMPGYKDMIRRDKAPGDLTESRNTATFPIHFVTEGQGQQIVKCLALQTALEKHGMRFQPIGEVLEQSAEHAFHAGWHAKHQDALNHGGMSIQRAWSEYTPPEEFTGL